MKRPRKIRAFNRVQPQMTEEDQRRQQFISPSKHKLNPYLMIHFNLTEQFYAGEVSASATITVSATACDIYYNNVVVLLPMDGENNSTVFTDYSPSPKTMTANGNAVISTTQSKFGGSSAYFDGIGDYVNTPSITPNPYDLGSISAATAYTIEGWFRVSSFISDENVAVSHALPGSGGNGIGGWFLGFSNTGKINFVVSKNSSVGTGWYARFETGTGVINTGVWYNIAVNILNGTPKIFVNGSEATASFYLPGNTLYASSLIGMNTTKTNYGLFLGALATDSTNPSPSQYFNGYIDDLRITKDVGRYTSNFAEPTEAFPREACNDLYYANTSLLLPIDGTNGSTTFTDYSPTPKTVTANGNVQISTTQSKFGGASGYFDGTGDYLSIPTSTAFAFGTGDFTIEMWIYRSSSGQQHIYEGRNGTTVNTILLYLNASTYLTYYANGATRISTTSIPALNTWVHIAVCRSGTSTKMFMDGVQVGSTYTDTFNYAAPTTSLYIGTNDVASGSFLNGYIDDLRVTKGIARYTTAFTPPIFANPLP